MKKNRDDISIFSLDELADLVASQRTAYNIVSIRCSSLPESHYAVFRKYRRNYRNIHVEVFDDIEFPREGQAVVEPEQVELILAWAKNKKNIAVHCTAGISRSSAIAYLIACSKMPASEAIKILNPDCHCPNDLVLYYGIKVLNDISVYDEYMKWIRKAGLPPKNERQRKFTDSKIIRREL